MTTDRHLAGAMLLVVASVTLVTPSEGQTPTMPSTQRYGSGLLDIPVSSVRPHLAVTTTFSGFWTSLGRRIEVDEAGQPAGFGPGRSDFFGDISTSVGLFDRAEVGVAIQSLNDATEGGDIWGLFGRVRLWEPIDQGLGFAVGGRYLTSPSFGGPGFSGGTEYAPGRLGFPDERLRATYTGGERLDTNLSLYSVATAYLRGYDGGFLPENDLTFTLGYGGGMFGGGGGLDFYAPGTNNGWFFGTAVHMSAGERSQVTVMAEHNGFDINLGAQVDWNGLRVGVQGLALNHDWPTDGQFSEYQKPKFGFTLSAAICPLEPGFRCRPRMMRRTEPDTIYIPPPPPDTIRVGDPDASVTVVSGEPGSMCLATGQTVSIEVTAAGDTLVGTPPVPIRSLRPAMTFAGSYGGSAFWYLDDEVVVFEGGDFGKSEDTFPIDCSQILRVGVYRGVPVFAVISARRPLDVIFIPVRPGVWHRYERGLRRSPSPS
ncbi:MAG: hypothetical protein ACPHO4_10085 [Longimicrobiales bacterium]